MSVRLNVPTRYVGTDDEGEKCACCGKSYIGMFKARIRGKDYTLCYDCTFKDDRKIETEAEYMKKLEVCCGENKTENNLAELQCRA